MSGPNLHVLEVRVVSALSVYIPEDREARLNPGFFKFTGEVFKAHASNFTNHPPVSGELLFGELFGTSKAKLTKN